MKISVLTPDLSHNCLGRAYLLAKILQRRYQVEIAGPIFGEGIWPPVINDKTIKYKSVKISGRFRPYLQISQLAKKIDGDVIYASKPLFTSFGIGLIKKLLHTKPLVLDIDDWEMGFMKEDYLNFSPARRLKFLLDSALYFYNEGSYWNRFLGEKMFKLADEITVSNRFLQRKFTGTIIWHARDTAAFDPSKFDQALMRQKYGISQEKKVAMFLGSHGPHKGIEDFIAALSLLKDSNLLLVLVGLANNQYSARLKAMALDKLGKARVRFFGFQPFAKIPEFLAISDLIVIPQKKDFATVGQMPAKVFDAMAMAKPIIATAVSGLPEVLADCGFIVEPENPLQLAKMIKHVFSHPQPAKKMGQKAREKCIKQYSWDALEITLASIFDRYQTP